MSNEYKDWIYDKVTDIPLNKGLLDYVTYAGQGSNDKYYVLGFKRDEWKGCRVWLDEDDGWQCEEFEPDPNTAFPCTNEELSYKKGWHNGYVCAQEEAGVKIQQLSNLCEHLRSQLIQMREEMIASQRGW